MDMRFYRRLPRNLTWHPTGFTIDPPAYEEDENEIARLRSVARSLLKYFVGVE
jgi:hypothetical protein